MNGQQFQAPIPSTKSIEDAKLISGALDTLNKVSIKCKKANDAIMSGNKIRMWNVLQELINEYGDAINQNHRNTGMQVVFANINSHTIDQIKNQLIWMQRFIYQYETNKFAADETVKHIIKSFLKNTGLFSDAELMII